MTTSLCGNSFGCLAFEDGAVGFELSFNGEHECGRCMSIAIAIIEFFVGEPIEFVSVLGRWVRKSKIQEELEDLLLWQALKPEMEKLRRLSDVKPA